jgi:FkbM family methyltransferase
VVKMFLKRAARALARVLARYLRGSPFGFGKTWLLRLVRTSLLPRAPPFGEAVCLREGPQAKMWCFGLGGHSAPTILAEWLFYTGHWQPALSRWLVSTLKPGDTFVDVGANSGYFSLLAATSVGATGRVVAVEACPTTFENLRANLAHNWPMSKPVRALHLAASDAQGHATLYQHRNEPLYNTTVAGAGAGGVAAASDVWSVLQKSAALDAGALSAVSALAAETSSWREVQVQRARLDDVLCGDETSPRVVKIDVEGGEWAVLRGLDRLLRRADLAVDIVVELSPKWLKLQASSAKALLAHMRARGFHAYALPSDDYEITRCHASGRQSAVPPRPRRLRDGDVAVIDAGEAQLDVIFSRTDAEWL